MVQVELNKMYINIGAYKMYINIGAYKMHINIGAYKGREKLRTKKKHCDFR